MISHFIFLLGIIGFCIGASFAKIGLTIYSLTTLAVIISIASLIATRKILVSIFFIFHAIQGFNNHGEESASQSKAVSVITSQAYSDYSIVTTSESKNLIVKGSYLVGSRGVAKCTMKHCRFDSSSVTYRTKTDEPSIKEKLLILLKNIRQPLLGFYASIYLGKNTMLNQQLKQTFKNTGVFHLLVISGLHFSLLASLMAKLLEFPFRFLNLFRFLPPQFLPRIKISCIIISIIIAWIYSNIIGFGPSVQRALLLHTLISLSKCFLSQPPLPNLVISGFYAQIVLFPLNLICLGTLLSWGAYLLLVFHDKDVKNNLSTSLLNSILHSSRNLIYLEMKLTLFTMTLLGQISSFWFLINIYAGTIFPLVMLSGIVVIFFPSSLIGSFLADLHLLFIDSLTFLSFNTKSPLDFPSYLRTTMITLSGFWLTFVSWKRITPLIFKGSFHEQFMDRQKHINHRRQPRGQN